ncbi:DUF167 domain-containing protein [Candidatus Nomurabacteria bacterium]|nr:DUF167 domain-containing protein [Candidatus Nomurabacteria bacterium]
MQYIHVKVGAEAGKESFAKKNEDHFEIFVHEKAERNMANKKVLELVAEHFKVPISKVRIINGHHHRSKLLVVEENTLL